MAKGNPKLLLDEFGIVPSKALGQNFLFDQNIARKIVRLSDVNFDSNVVEVGCGLGILTSQLSESAKLVVGIEKDRRLFKYLSERPFNDNVRIVNEDALKLDMSFLLTESDPTCENWTLISNLPYNVATPLIIGLITKVSKIRSYIVMVQSEVADRFTAKPSTKSYGSVTIKLNYLATVDKLMNVPPHVFYPAPKVNSTVVRIQRKENKELQPNNIQELFNLIDEAFVNRRKMLKNNLFNSVSSGQFKIARIDPTLRAENLTVSDFIRLYNSRNSTYPHNSMETTIFN